MIPKAFCIARIGEPVEAPDGCDVHFVSTELSDTAAVIEFLQKTYDRFATLIADQNADGPDHERIDLSTIGGFGVRLTNRFGSKIEIGLGREFCVLIHIDPQSSAIDRGTTNRDGRMVFYLDGWHHTELEISQLIARDDCLSRLRNWLEADAIFRRCQIRGSAASTIASVEGARPAGEDRRYSS